MKGLKDNWKTNIHFAAFVGEFELADVEYAIDDIAVIHFTRADAVYAKYFSQWRDDYLCIVLKGDNVPARYIANWLPEVPSPNDLSLEYYSEKHKTTILVPNFEQYSF